MHEILYSNVMNSFIDACQSCLEVGTLLPTDGFTSDVHILALIIIQFMFFALFSTLFIFISSLVGKGYYTVDSH